MATPNHGQRVTVSLLLCTWRRIHGHRNADAGAPDHQPQLRTQWAL